MNWDEEKRHFVQELWPDHSAGAIADEVGSHFREPCNRNMIMGIAHRLHLAKKGMGKLPKINTRAARPRPAQKKQPKIILSPSLPPKKYPAWDIDPPSLRSGEIGAPLTTQPCTIVELDDSRCRWPLGNIDDIATLFCCAPAAAGWPYCAHHVRMAYQPPNHGRAAA